MKERKFIVRLSNGIALKFHTNLAARKVFSAVRDDEATTFDREWEAELKAKEHGLREGTYEIGTVEMETEIAEKV